MSSRRKSPISRRRRTLQIEQYPSQNFGSRGSDQVELLILHHTATPSTQVALDTLTDTKTSNRVSAHYLISPEGKIYQLVDEKNSAWHGGRSFWQGFRDVNTVSIGIEIQNRDGNFYDYPPAQKDAILALTKDIVQRRRIRVLHVIGHSDIAPNRKDDPGSHFPWPMLAQNGVGFVPSPTQADRDASASWDNSTMRKKLQEFGYVPDQSVGTVTLITAFQRHWQPAAIGTAQEGKADADTKALLAALLSKKAGNDAKSKARRKKRNRLSR